MSTPNSSAPPKAEPDSAGPPRKRVKRVRQATGPYVDIPGDLTNEQLAQYAASKGLPLPKNDPKATLHPRELVSQILFGDPETTPTGTVDPAQTKAAANLGAQKQSEVPQIGVLIVEQLTNVRNKYPDIDDDVMKIYHLTTFLAEYTSNLIALREQQIQEQTKRFNRIVQENGQLKAQLKKAQAADSEPVKRALEDMSKKLKAAEQARAGMGQEVERLNADVASLRAQLSQSREQDGAAIASLTSANAQLTHEYLRMQTYARHLEVELSYARPPPQAPPHGVNGPQPFAPGPPPQYVPGPQPPVGPGPSAPPLNLSGGGQVPLAFPVGEAQQYSQQEAVPPAANGVGGLLLAPPPAASSQDAYVAGEQPGPQSPAPAQAQQVNGNAGTAATAVGGDAAPA